MFKLLVDINTKFGSRLHVWQLRVQGPVLPHTDSRVDTHQLTTRSIENITRQKPYTPFFKLFGAKQSRNNHKSEQKPFVTLASDG